MNKISLPPEIKQLRRRQHDFTRGEALPCDTQPAYFDKYGNIAEDLLQQLRGKAKAARLWAPEVPKARGGLGFGVTRMAA